MNKLNKYLNNKVVMLYIRIKILYIYIHILLYIEILISHFLSRGIYVIH
jgi:hypothetical protein